MNRTSAQNTISLLLTSLFFSIASLSAHAEPPKMRMTTDIPSSIVMPDKIETRIGTLEFFDGFPSADTVQKTHDYLYFSRAVDIYLDEMRAASMVALRQGLREAGAIKSNQIALFESLMDSKSLYLTANSETVYGMTFLDLSDGPIVIESPPNVLGILDDMWMRYVGDIGNAGPDRGLGGKFVVLPPGFEGDVPEGYHVFHSKTYGVWFAIRGFLINGKPQAAVASFKEKLKVYPLENADNPPKMEFINVSGKAHNTIHGNNSDFYMELNSLIQEEHDDAIDPVSKGRLALIGIEKGIEFNPDDRTKEILTEAAVVAASIVRSLSYASQDDQIYFYPEDDRSWFSAFAIGNHEFLSGSWLHRDARSIFMYNATGITPAMAVKMVGVGAQYAAACRDADANYLDGGKTYKLTLPSDIPAEDFWSIVLYDSQTRSMLQTDQQFPSINNLTGNPEVNEDGSVDLYFGPKAPTGMENNWAQTVPSKAFWVMLRLYAPLEPWFDKTWRPGKIELLEK